MPETTVKCTGKVRDLDGTPGRPFSASSPNGCGTEFAIDIPDDDPGLPDSWDVDTDPAGTVTRRHKVVLCPACGVHTYIVKEA